MKENNQFEQRENKSVEENKKNRILKVVKEGVNNAADVLSSVKENVAATVEEAAENIKTKAEEVREEIERNFLKPVFPNEFISNHYEVPDMLRIISGDTKHESSKACEGSIGFIDVIQGYKVLNIYKKDIDVFFEKEIEGYKMHLNPTVDFDFFHVHPCNKHVYINMNDYFESVKQDKIAELQKIAYDLGAKEVTINYLEETKTLTGNKYKATAKAKVAKKNANGKIDINNKTSRKNSYSEDIIEHYEGSDNPKKPNLVYFRNSKSIENLIEERINGSHGVHEIDKIIKCSTSLGIKKSEAAKIDAAFKFYKIQGNASVSSEVEEENRTIFKYHIVF